MGSRAGVTERLVKVVHLVGAELEES